MNKVRISQNYYKIFRSNFGKIWIVYILMGKSKGSESYHKCLKYRNQTWPPYIGEFNPPPPPIKIDCQIHCTI